VVVLHLITQALMLGLCIVTLVALWWRAPVAAFSVFLVWTVAFYTAMFIFAWHLRPDGSVLSVVCSRLRPIPQDTQKITPSPTPMPEPATGPYVHHQPPYHATVSPEDGSPIFSPVEQDEPDDDIDDDTRQRMIEEEMGRRDVSIVTVPKRKLWIANPS